MASRNSPGALRAECVSVQVCEPGGVGEGVWEAELDRTLSEAGASLVRAASMGQWEPRGFSGRGESPWLGSCFLAGPPLLRSLFVVSVWGSVSERPGGVSVECLDLVVGGGVGRRVLARLPQRGWEAKVARGTGLLRDSAPMCEGRGAR